MGYFFFYALPLQRALTLLASYGGAKTLPIKEYANRSWANV